MNEEVRNRFSSRLDEVLGKKFELKWDIDKKGVVCGWCRLVNPEDIYPAAKLVAEFKGRVMTISALNTPIDFEGKLPLKEPDSEAPINLVINYHLYFQGINCTFTITLPDNKRSVKSITPVLKSADWHEREMQDLFNIKLEGHPNPKRLFLDDSIHMEDHTMIPLSEAMNEASTNTLWEKLMQSGRKDVDNGEQL